MSANFSRSMNADLYLGSQVDGRKKTIYPNRGGTVEQERLIERAKDLQEQYGVAHMNYSYAESCGH
jgi:hypothetical protein